MSVFCVCWTTHVCDIVIVLFECSANISKEYQPNILSCSFLRVVNKIENLVYLWTFVKLAGPISWVQRQMEAGVDPRTVLGQIVPHDTVIPADLDDLTLWKIVINLIAEPPKRHKLSHINTLENVMHLLTTCKRIMVLTGAGVSISFTTGCSSRDML